MHLSDYIAATLLEFGWKAEAPNLFAKRLLYFAEPGALSPGHRVVRLRLDDAGRWLERVDGWGNVDQCIDLRGYDSPRDAINAALD